MRVLLLLCALLIAVPASAQAGPDMVTGLMMKKKLFQPHPNSCDADEVFVAVQVASGMGFCIEKTQRAPLLWSDARSTCLDLNKRLPEGPEFTLACRNSPPGLTGMVGDYEWASNSGWYEYGRGLLAPVVGRYDCQDLDTEPAIDYYSATAVQYAFRCLR